MQVTWTLFKCEQPSTASSDIHYTRPVCILVLLLSQAETHVHEPAICLPRSQK